MTLPIISYRCRRCGYSQINGLDGSYIYAYPNGESIPVVFHTGWCHVCNAVRDIEDLSIHPRVEQLKSLQQALGSVQKNNRLLFKSWTYDARMWPDDPEWRERITGETYATWADQIGLAIKSIEFLHTRQSPPRCLNCGGTRHDTGSLSGIEFTPETELHHTLLHPGCGGVLELHIEGDMFINNPRSLRGYSTEGDFVGHFEDPQDKLREDLDLNHGGAFVRWLRRKSD